MMDLAENTQERVKRILHNNKKHRMFTLFISNRFHIGVLFILLYLVTFHFFQTDFCLNFFFYYIIVFD